MRPLGAAVASDRQRQQDNERNIFEGSHWGDTLDPVVTENCIRCSFVNINGIGFKNNSFKSKTIQEYMSTYSVDVMGLAELGVNWRVNGNNNSLWERSLKWFENQRLSVGYNKRDKFSNRSQPGGTAIFSQDRIALGICKNGSDDRKLGRWTWSIFEGKQRKKTRFVSVYVPIKPANYGDSKVYYQHQRALLDDNITADPIDQFWTDFWTDVDKWLSNGEELVIMGDWNNNVIDSDVRRNFEDRNMRAAVTGEHRDTSDVPATHQKGQVPIDEAFVTPGLQIVKSGYLCPGHLPSDHVGLFLDIRAREIIGENRTEIPKSTARRLKCDDPRAVKKYLHVFHKYLRKHDFYTRILKLVDTYSNPLSAADAKELEKLDKLRHNGMTLAEQKCRKFKMGKFFWSLPFQSAKDMLRYVTLSLSRKKGANISASLLIRLANKVDHNLAQATIDEIEKDLIAAQKSYNEVCSKSEELRRTFLENLAVALEEEGKGKKATIMRVLLTREQDRRMYRRIKALKTAGEGSLSTSFVNVKNPDGSITSVSKKEDLERAIINENIKKYHQCENTPFFKEPLVSDFGRFGEGPCTKQVAEGTYEIPPNVDSVTADFIRECKQSPEIQQEGEFPLPRSPEDYRQYWRKMKEKTASRELHFGHFKAGMQHDLISTIHWLMAEIPMRTGYTLNRWKNATDVMILKKSGLYDVEKLRTIVLFEADFNANNKYMGRSAIRHCVKKNRLAQEQYSIPGRKSIDHALNKRLLFDIVRYEKYSLAISSCDLKSNYDRIGHVPSVLATQRLGLPNEPMFSMYRGVQEMQHTTRTAYGDSMIVYGGLEVGYLFYQQGVYQGNGFGPPGWGIISSALFDMMRKKGFGAKIISPITNSENKLIGFAFVDDTDILASTPNSNDADTTHELMQQTIDYWESAAKTTGGAIAPDKSWYYLIHFKWTNGKWSYGDPHDVVHESLTCLNKNDQRVELKALPVNKAEEMLGVYLSPDGSNAKQLQELMKKANTKSTQLKKGYVNRYEAWVALSKVACKSIEYPLPALTLKESECRKIMTPLLQAYLPVAGINRHFPHVQLYGTSRYKGLGLKNLHTTQNVSHIADMVDHLWQNSPTGHFFQCAIESLQLELGLSGNVFNLDYNKYSRALLTDSLVRETWKYASVHNITIDIPGHRFTLATENDSLIMEQVYRYCEPSSWAAINRCRHFLQVLTVSDITTSDGRHLHPAIFKKQRRHESFHPNIRWPKWGMPSYTDWRKWKKYIPIALLHQSSTLLRQPLGHWNIIPTKWKWHYRRQDHRLWHHDGQQWHEHHKSGHSPRLFHFKVIADATYPSAPDDNLIPVTVAIESTRIVMHPIPRLRPTPVPPRNNTTTTFSISHQIHIRGSFQQICQSIIDGTVVCVSDGSYTEAEDNIATAAWTISTADGKHRLQGLVIVPGMREQKDAYRAELAGIVGIFETLLSIQKRIQSIASPTTAAHIYCDGKSVLDKLRWLTVSTCSSRLHHFDLLSYAVKLKEAIQLQLTFTHVKGHQDDNIALDDLSFPAQLNVQMDSAAKAFSQYVLHSSVLDNHTPLTTSLQIPTVRHNNNIIHQKLRQHLYDSIHEEKQLQYWLNKGAFSRYTHSLIDWDIHQQGFNTLTHTRKVFSSKWSTGFCATGRSMERWQCREVSNCPFCQQTNENTLHILRCQHAEATSSWTDAIDTFNNKLFTIDTSPMLRHYIQLELNWWRNHPNTLPPHIIPPPLREAITQQRSIGWRYFLEGYIATSILHFQNNYFKDKNSYKTISMWGSSVLRGGIEVLFSVWQNRNDKIHNTPLLAELEGEHTLNVTIRNEFTVGRSRLPPRFQRYFQVGIDKVLSETLNYRKNWLRTVRRARENFFDNNILEDEFSDENGYFRQWINL